MKLRPALQRSVQGLLTLLAWVFLLQEATAQPVKTDANLLRLRCPDTARAEFITTKGNFVVEIYRHWSPLGADRFYQLIRSGYYNNNLLFRVVQDYLVQTGVSEDKAKNIFWQGRNIKDEPVVGTNIEGTLCFSRGNPNTRKTSFFINLRDNLTYDTMNIAGVKGFVPFARITSGLDIAKSFFSDYGNDTLRSADTIYFKGNAWMVKKFPGLDLIREVRIVQ
ncbi:MAG TPA: peptidylprolyl isomerase [Lacibacter sp.]|nr:peptidylprolyl isomerase [Lacibacter sp.]HMO88968.1 peptidylprolyl isomerase [Lacibacter sp.]HMP87408.1 peptidylprolyl isomerase [Lacibacter sp.]